MEEASTLASAVRQLWTQATAPVTRPPLAVVVANDGVGKAMLNLTLIRAQVLQSRQSSMQVSTWASMSGLRP